MKTIVSVIFVLALGGGLPTLSIRDFEIKRREKDLVVASFGHGFQVLDDDTLLRNVSTDSLQNALHLYPSRQTLWYVQENRLGGNKEPQGDNLCNAENPDYGAVIR
jgi:hypothetical protein